MRRIFRVSGPRRLMISFALIICAILLVAVRRSLPTWNMQDPLTWAIAVIIPAGLIILLVQTVVDRTIADDLGLRRYDSLNRLRFSFRWEEINAYRPLGNGWIIIQDQKAYRLGDICYADLHPIIVDHAPHALAAARIRFGQLPPDEDYVALCAFDGQGWMRQFVPFALLFTPLVMFLGPRILLYAPIFWIDLVYRLKDIFVTLNLTRDTLSVSWPGGSRTIPWHNVTAIFCEQKDTRRHFIVTAVSNSITLPPSVAGDLDYMRKVFYSLPEDTKCVNFDPSFKGGYRRRGGKRRRVPGQLAPDGVLDPQMTRA